MIERLNDYIQPTLFWLASGLAAGIGWLVRRVLTDHRRLELLEQKQELQNHAIVAVIEALSGRFDRLEKSNDLAIQNQAAIVEMLSKMKPGGGA